MARTRHPRPEVAAASRLRRSQTDAENRLWSHLRSQQLLGVKFRRQQPIGRFIVDFCCVEPKLIIEVDGGQHAQRVAVDQERRSFLTRSGYRVMRFWNHEVLGQIEEALGRIAEEIEKIRSERSWVRESVR